MLSYAISLSLMKILLLPSYRSTDFEVHRNWLAITHSLPLREWYTNETSEWTLDYPPFFAWFEWILSKFAFYFDPKMLAVHNLNYASDMTVLFQRLSVICTDLVLAYALKECIEEIKKLTKDKHRHYKALFLVIFGNAGLLLVDHIHFQYNGFLFGVMFLSIARILQKREIESAFWFCVLLNLKHIYLYIAPAYFVYLLRSFCFQSRSDGSIKWLSLSFTKLLTLAAVVVGVFAISFGPFVAMGQLPQVLSRLFPFKRGLSHAYWAPNFWAFYNFVDKMAKVVGVRFGLVTSTHSGSMTGGLVQEYEHSVLPSISPLVTFILTFVAMVPCLVVLWRSPHNPWQFVRAVTICSYCSYLFGWHVHEKAILMVVLPLSLLCLLNEKEGKLFLFLSIVANFSLFPLIFTSYETVIKVIALLLHTSVVRCLLERFWGSVCGDGKRCLVLSPFESAYLLGLVPLFIYEQSLHRILGLDVTLPFLPLMMISVYCSLGVIYCWCALYVSLLRVRSSSSEKKRKSSFNSYVKLKDGTFFKSSIKLKNKPSSKADVKLKKN